MNADSLAKKREKTYQKWQTFKTHQRDEKHAQLKKKLTLQHELIKAYDTRHLQLMIQEEQRLTKVREQQKAEKQDREEALQQHSKHELAIARKRHKNHGHLEMMNTNQKIEIEPYNVTMETAEATPSSLSPLKSNPRTHAKRHAHSNEQKRALSTLIDESNEEDEMMPGEGEATSGGAVDDETVFHKDVLYQMFGKKEADYFLYPRVEPQKTKRIRVPLSVRKQGGRAGADILWTTLRDKSQVRLKRADALIPQELTQAYGAFVRECLTNNKTVPARSFYSEEGIPESEQIQDKSYHQKMKELRHHMALMYRSSQINEDKTSVLLYNNPMPDFSDSQGVEGPKRYWPSWLDQEEVDEEDEPEYKRWLKEIPSPWPQAAPLESPSPSHQLKVETRKQQRRVPSFDDKESPEDDCNDSDAGSWEAPVPVIGKEAPTVIKEKPKKITFLTEKAATCEGQFRKKFEKTEGPKPYVPGTDVMVTAGLPVEEKAKPKPKTAGSSRQTRDSKLSQRRSHTAPAHPGASGDARTGARSTHGGAPWQPLSMVALNDYTPGTTLLGQGDYAHGQQFMWKPVLAESNTTK